MFEVKKVIKSDRLIMKFSLYGFLKNLRFFEPFLIIYLLSMDLNLLTIGVLYSIREVVIYIFEVPSGIFADNYGKKTELSICFLFYIVSFIFFFIGGSFFILCIAMFFYGMGEAFRSGTHKAIIMEYLEEKDWFKYKSFIYGRTRSFSLIGSSISSFVSIFFLLTLGNLRILFLICIIPYILDFILILSYPKRFNQKHAIKVTYRGFLALSLRQLKSIFTNRPVLKVVLSSSIFDAVLKGIKDYIQPVLQSIILLSAVTVIKGFSPNDTLAIYLAVIYGIVYIGSSFASRNAYRLNKLASSEKLMRLFMDILGAVFLLLALFIKLEALYVIIILYFFIYILKDARRPLFVDAIGDIMKKEQRATILSIDSQLKALFMVAFAPLFGWIADTFSITVLFLILGIFSILINRFIKLKIKNGYVSQ
jgi:MFS family permease